MLLASLTFYHFIFVLGKRSQLCAIRILITIAYIHVNYSKHLRIVAILKQRNLQKGNVLKSSFKKKTLLIIKNVLSMILNSLKHFVSANIFLSYLDFVCSVFYYHLFILQIQRTFISVLNGLYFFFLMSSVLITLYFSISHWYYLSREFFSTRLHRQDFLLFTFLFKDKT